MPVIKKVELRKDEVCANKKCRQVIKAGNIAVKDGREKGKTKYFHTTCVK